ncbi:MAG: hypothetical protein HYZ89_01565 [Candidatus Omnitrophica bacterium]|nr:hypothetical protein [Candidatus Omnitrophota bacterium]
MSRDRAFDAPRAPRRDRRSELGEIDQRHLDVEQRPGLLGLLLHKFRFAEFIQKRQSRQREGRTQGTQVVPIPRSRFPRRGSGSLGERSRGASRGTGRALPRIEDRARHEVSGVEGLEAGA